MTEEDHEGNSEVKTKKKKKSADDKTTKKTKKGKPLKKSAKASSSDDDLSPKVKKKKNRNNSLGKFKQAEGLPDVGGSSPGVLSRKKLDAEKIKKKVKTKKVADKTKVKKKKPKTKKSMDSEASAEDASPVDAPPMTDADEKPKYSAAVLLKKLEKVELMLQETDPASDKYQKILTKQQEYIQTLKDMGVEKQHEENDGQLGEMRLNDDDDDNDEDYDDGEEYGEMGLKDPDEDGGEYYGEMGLNDDDDDEGYGEMGLNDDDDGEGGKSNKRSGSNASNPAWSRSFRAEKEKLKRRQESLGRHQERKKSMRNSLKEGNKSIKKRTRGVRQALNAGVDFEVPVFKKTREENNFLKESLKGDFVFQNLERKSFRLFLDAFELVEYKKGETIMEQGDMGDFFYVLAEGKVKFHTNGKLVGRAERGQSFGEAALLYAAPRAATATAAEDSMFYRVDQQTFKFITQTSAQEIRIQKLELLRNVDFLDNLLNDDLQRLCDLMVPQIVKQGDYLYQKDGEADAFYLLQSGEMRATDIVVGDTTFEDIIIQPGDYFGQNALARDSPRENSVIAEVESTVFGIDRTTFDKVLGSFYNVILKTNDRQLLGHIEVIKDLGLDSFQLISLAEQVVEVQFIEGEEIFVEGEDIEPALYLVRDGTVEISVGAGDDVKTVQEDVYFGDDVLLSKEDVVPARYTVTALEDVICGCLTVKACRLVLDLQANDNTTSSGSGGGTELSLASSATMQRRAELAASFESDELTIEELDKIRIVGEGEYGKVWLTKAPTVESKEVFALKIQQLEQDGESYYDNIKREVATIGCLHHPYIVGLIHSKFTGKECFMVMDFISGGELWSVIHREYPDGRWESGVSAKDAQFYSLIIADTISYMHRRNILFRDLKPENVMIDADGYPNIIDFGFAKVCEDKAFTFCGTPNYVAPEIVLNAGHSIGVDHWALGVMIYEMLSGENPFWYEGIDTMTLYEIIVKDEPYPLEKEHSDPAAENLIDGLLEKDPSQRLGVLAGKDKDILFHEWYDGWELQQLRHKKIEAPWLPPKKEEN